MRKTRGLCRKALLILGIAFVVLCRYMPDMAEWYARTVYPALSAALSAFSSLFPFPLMEVFVVSLILALILYPIRLRKKGIRLRKIIFREGEILAWVYVWFYLGWGLNYYRHNIYVRMQTPPVAYEEQHFQDFLKEYTEQLNTTYQPSTEIDDEELKQHIHAFYANLPASFGLAQPKSWQEPKPFIFAPYIQRLAYLVRWDLSLQKPNSMPTCLMCNIPLPMLMNSRICWG